MRALRLSLVALGVMAAMLFSAFAVPVPAPAENGERNLLYVAVPGIRNYLEFGGAGLLVFDIDQGHKFVKRIETPARKKEKPENIKGICACAVTKRLYFSTLTRLYCVDLASEETLWEKALPGGADRMAISPDGKRLYVPSLEGPHWNVVDGDNGEVLARVETNSGAHNTVCGLDGSRVYLAGLKSPLLNVLDARTGKLLAPAGPFGNSVRPFTVNGAQTLCFVNVNELLGFEVGDLRTGKLLHRVEVEGFKKGPIKRHGCPSHGVGLTPDEKEVWVCDAANQRVHVFDAAVMPPKQLTSIALREQPGWVTFSLDGRYAYPSTGEIVDVKNKKIVAVLTDEKGREVHSEKMVQIVFKNSVPVRNGDQFGVGRITSGLGATGSPRANRDFALAVAGGQRVEVAQVSQKEEKPRKPGGAARPATDGPPPPTRLWVYVGTYTGAKSKGIYRLDLDLATGKIESKGLASEAVNPSFLAIHPNQKFLYAVSEVSDVGGKKTGAVAAFAIDAKTGKLTELNREPSGGAGPCHLITDGGGAHAFVANYGGGSVAVLPIAEDGKLKPPSSIRQHQGKSANPRRQEAPHAHSINLEPLGRFVFAADLGLDQVLVYKFDPVKGELIPNEPPSASVAPGAGPRHFAFYPTGRYAYVINEMLCTITAFAYNSEKGVLKEIQTITTLPHEVKEGYSTAEVVVHPSGKFLYGSNRGHDSIAIFRIDRDTGRLTAAGHEPTQGKTPRNFNVDPTGKFLLAANQNSDSIVVFRIDPQTGTLRPTGQTIEVPSPVCIRFMPAPEGDTSSKEQK